MCDARQDGHWAVSQLRGHVGGLLSKRFEAVGFILDRGKTDTKGEELVRVKTLSPCNLMFNDFLMNIPNTRMSINKLCSCWDVADCPLSDHSRLGLHHPSEVHVMHDAGSSSRSAPRRNAHHPCSFALRPSWKLSQIAVGIPKDNLLGKSEDGALVRWHLVGQWSRSTRRWLSWQCLVRGEIQQKWGFQHGGFGDMIQQKWGFYQHIWAFKSNWLHILEPGFVFFLGCPNHRQNVMEFSGLILMLVNTCEDLFLLIRSAFLSDGHSMYV